MCWRIVKVRFPKDLYLGLRLEAARRKISIAALVRETLGIKLKDKSSVLDSCGMIYNSLEMR